ncbi:hypothetical protein TNCV_4277111 [Trichonephila clavipes]|nr:hypothetical protein TNCV_4277111 [Trichonephila clavipes]
MPPLFMYAKSCDSLVLKSCRIVADMTRVRRSTTKETRRVEILYVKSVRGAQTVAPVGMEWWSDHLSAASTSKDILHLFQLLLDRHLFNYSESPSHVGLLENDVTEDLAKAAASNPVDPADNMVRRPDWGSTPARECMARAWVVLLYTHGTLKDTQDPPYHSRVPKIPVNDCRPSTFSDDWSPRMHRT